MEASKTICSDILKFIFGKKCNIRLTQTICEEVSVPLKTGGIGLRRTDDISLPVYLRSIYATTSLTIEEKK